MKTPFPFAIANRCIQEHTLDHPSDRPCNEEPPPWSGPGATQERLSALNVNTTAKRTLVVADAQLEDIELLLTDLDPMSDVVLLPSDQNALHALSFLLHRNAYHNLVLIGHGQPGKINLGSEGITAAQCQQHQNSIAHWNVHSILLYSCFVAADRTFIDTLETMSGATVFASTERIGQHQHHSNWLLQTHAHPHAHYHCPFDPIALREWPHTLSGNVVHAIATDSTTTHGSISTAPSLAPQIDFPSGYSDTITQYEVFFDGTLASPSSTSYLQDGHSGIFTYDSAVAAGADYNGDGTNDPSVIYKPTTTYTLSSTETYMVNEPSASGHGSFVAHIPTSGGSSGSGTGSTHYDLTIDNITIDSSNGEIQINIRNSGTANLPTDDGRLYVYFNDEPTPTWTYSFSTWSDKSYKTAGGTQTISPQTLTARDGLEIDSICAVIDASDFWAEIDESNNEYYVTINSSDEIDTAADDCPCEEEPPAMIVTTAPKLDLTIPTPPTPPPPSSHHKKSGPPSFYQEEPDMKNQSAFIKITNASDFVPDASGNNKVMMLTGVDKNDHHSLPTTILLNNAQLNNNTRAVQELEFYVENKNTGAYTAASDSLAFVQRSNTWVLHDLKHPGVYYKPTVYAVQTIKSDPTAGAAISNAPAIANFKASVSLHSPWDSTNNKPTPFKITSSDFNNQSSAPEFNFSDLTNNANNNTPQLLIKRDITENDFLYRGNMQLELIPLDTPDNVQATFGDTLIITTKVGSGQPFIEETKEFSSHKIKIGGAKVLPGEELSQLQKPNSTITDITFNDRYFDMELTTQTGAPFSINFNVNLIANAITSNFESQDDTPRNENTQWTFFSAKENNYKDVGFDPTSNQGIRVFDTDGDGIGDHVTGVLQDGGRGDPNGASDGRIDLQLISGVATLDPDFGSSSSDSSQKALRLTDTQKTSVKANHLVGATLDPTTLSSTSDQIVYVVLDAADMTDDKGSTAEQWLENLSFTTPGGNTVNGIQAVQHRGNTLFNTLESQDTTDLASGQNKLYSREFLLGNDQAIVFARVLDKTLEDTEALTDLELFSSRTTADDQATLECSNGFKLTLDEINNRDQGLDALMAQHQDIAPVLDFYSMPSAVIENGVNISIEVAREADHDTTVGFYQVNDAHGAVKDNDNNLVLPGDDSYAFFALQDNNQVSGLSNLRANDDSTTSSTATINTNSMMAPYATVNGQTFFAYAEANGDGISHFKNLGSNVIGVEDIFGGGDKDYDDLVIGIEIGF